MTGVMTSQHYIISLHDVMTSLGDWYLLTALVYEPEGLPPPASGLS